MIMSLRFQASSRAAGIHLLVSLLVAGIVAALVFLVWYPQGLHRLTGGSALFLILMGVDVVCGPLLTLVLFNPHKARHLWRMDLGLIVMLQAGALFYGLTQVAKARPVYIAFEGDSFRVVQAFDVDETRLPEAPAALARLPLTGPEPIGVRIAESSDADFLASLQLSLKGEHSAFRPGRWLPYGARVDAVKAALKPIERLQERNVDGGQFVDRALGKLGVSPHQVGYLPLVRDVITDWVVVIDRSSGQPLAYWPVDGW